MLNPIDCPGQRSNVRFALCLLMPLFIMVENIPDHDFHIPQIYFELSLFHFKALDFTCYGS